MKKLIPLFLFLILMISLTACSSSNGNTSSSSAISEPSSSQLQPQNPIKVDQEKGIYGKDALNIKASGENLNDDELLRLYGDPDTYANRPVKLSGVVSEANNRDDGYLIIQIYMSHDDNPAIILLPEDAPFLQVDSFVTIDGIVLGSVSGDDELGVPSVWPTIVAKEISQQ